MLSFFKRFFDYNEKEIIHLRKIVDEVNALEGKARSLKDTSFPKETVKLKNCLADGVVIDEVLPWAFALVREASRRTIQQRHFDVQIMAGIALHEGKVAEQKTGEGKTLSATTALYLNALTGKGAHLVTVNDYLARRDCGWMGMLYDFLGVQVSAIISDKSFIFDPAYTDEKAFDWRLSHLKEISRSDAYKADITYGINSEFGFDYLRDNMAGSISMCVQRGFNYAIIDEADSVLIDEARTPHIISAPYEEDVSRYYRYAQLVEKLDAKTDFVVDEKLKTAHINENGITKIESILHVANIYEKDFETVYHIEAALKARTLFKRDKDYIVKDNTVIIVDEFTGRLLYGRRFSEGLHQAIEAKEQVQIQKESKTLATVSLQNYFRMYKKLAGMTGTASTEAEELHKIYHINTIIIPTHRTMIRRDEPDMIYKTEKAKFDAVVAEIGNAYTVGRPVLVGTTSIEKNEYLSRLLRTKGIPHELLNAKNHEGEAAIIAKAGEPGAVTVATNMAGRGVDIILGGTEEAINQKSKIKDKKENQKKWQEKHDAVVKSGGLYVIGTERHESRRIDNQLRGRSGRQGDPGMSRFFVSLQDDLMRIFGGDQIARLMTFFNFPENTPLTHPMVSKAIEQAQVKVEGFNFDIRKHLVDFDDVLNKQREIIYGLRRKILVSSGKKDETLQETILELYDEEFADLSNSYLGVPGAVDVETFIKETKLVVPFDETVLKHHITSKNLEKVAVYLSDQGEKEFNARVAELGRDVWNRIIGMVYVSTIDKFWMDHLTAIEELREGINLRGYAQLDPLVEYKNEAFSMFEKLVHDINFEVTRRLFRVQVEKAPEPQPVQTPMIFKSASGIDPFTQKQKTGAREISAPQTPAMDQTPQNQTGFKIIPSGSKSTRKIGRNDPCWCGSGKKYKRCHYPQLS